MTHALPAPIRGATHVQVTARRDFPESGMVLHYRFGDMDGETFTPDPLLREIRRILSKPQADEIRDAAAADGAPAGEYRWADVLDYMDANDLW